MGLFEFLLMSSAVVFIAKMANRAPGDTESNFVWVKDDGPSGGLWMTHEQAEAIRLNLK